MTSSNENWYENQPRIEHKLNRIKAVYWYIKNNGETRTSELMDEFGVSSRTIQRDLSILIYNDLIHSCKKGVWTATDKKVKR